MTNWIDPGVWEEATGIPAVFFSETVDYREVIEAFGPDMELLRQRQEAWGKAWESVMRLALEDTSTPVIKWGTPRPRNEFTIED